MVAAFTIPYIAEGIGIALAAKSEEMPVVISKTIGLIKHIGVDNGGTIFEDCQLIDLDRDGPAYDIIVRRHDGKYERYRTEIFINALGPNADKFTRNLALETADLQSQQDWLKVERLAESLRSFF